jgi:hypothetical protein
MDFWCIRDKDINGGHPQPHLETGPGSASSGKQHWHGERLNQQTTTVHEQWSKLQRNGQGQTRRKPLHSVQITGVGYE